MSKNTKTVAAEEKVFTLREVKHQILDAAVVRDVDKVVVPQYFDPTANEFVPIVNTWGGSGGGSGSPGPKGDTGPQGPIGPEGPQGEVGPQGPKGDTGSPGPKGDTGDKGNVGNAGAKGEKGDTGDAGPAGTTGAEGPQGPKGDQGIQGIQGPQGLKGDTGAKGDPGQGGVTPLNNTLTSTATNEAATANVAKVLNDKIGVNSTEIDNLKIVKTDVDQLKKTETVLMHGSLSPSNNLSFPIGKHMLLIFKYVDEDRFSMAIQGVGDTPTLMNSASYYMHEGVLGMYFSHTSFYNIDKNYYKDLFPGDPIKFNQCFANLKIEEIEGDMAYGVDVNAFLSNDKSKNRIVLEVDRFSDGVVSQMEEEFSIPTSGGDAK